jgi:hypothetical protein
MDTKIYMFQFGNLANPRFIKGECSVKIERRAKRKKMQKRGEKNDTFIGSTFLGIFPSRCDASCRQEQQVHIINKMRFG